MNKLFVLIVLALTVVASVRGFEPISGRSHRWDDMISEHEARHKRETDSSWQSGVREACTLGDVTQFDTLGRRNSGLLAPVADQGMCGSCWALAAAHAVTDTKSIAAGRQTELLSAQYTNRCATRKSGYGCCGDGPARALRHYRDHGVATDVCLSYNPADSKAPFWLGIFEQAKSRSELTCFATCDDRSTYDPALMKINGQESYKFASDEFIINALRNGHVVIVGVLPNIEFRTQYRCGVYTSTETKRPKHAVVIVDYGTTDTGIDFWVIKNSWDTGFGEDGYFRIRRGDLGIGNNGVFIPLISTAATTPSDPDIDDVETCAPQEVSQPNNDTITMSAVEFALQVLADNRIVRCANGQAATGLNLTSFKDADVQVVAGTMVESTVQASLQGCGETVTKTLDIVVSIDLDGLFTLQSYQVQNAANTLTASLLILIIMMITSLVVNN